MDIAQQSFFVASSYPFLRYEYIHLDGSWSPRQVRFAMEKSRGLTNVLATLGLISGAVAMFAASCGMSSVVLRSLGEGASLLSTRELLATYHARILIFSAFLISFGWIVYLRRRGTKGTGVVLAIASLLVVTAANWKR